LGVVAFRALARLDETLDQQPFVRVNPTQQARRRRFPSEGGGAFR
jgi:hypothetical protein